jgi:hypothetical protein
LTDGELSTLHDAAARYGEFLGRRAVLDVR